MLEVGADQQKILRYWTKYAFLRIVYSSSIFSVSSRSLIAGVVRLSVCRLSVCNARAPYSAG